MFATNIQNEKTIIDDGHCLLDGRTGTEGSRV